MYVNATMEEQIAMSTMQSFIWDEDALRVWYDSKW